jgi:thiol-disulfide isomerase/thioredoxin
MVGRARLFVRLAMLVCLVCSTSCATPRPAAGVQNVTVSSVVLCDHRVPAAACVRCHPELVDAFRRQGDWCADHDIPESQCLTCHPGMKFADLPLLPAGADLRLVSGMGEDIPDLGAHLAPGKVTVVDFYAPWCVACRDLDVDLFRRLSSGARIAVRKANVMDWDSPLSKRYLAAVPSLPFVVVFDPNGKRVGEVCGYDADNLDRLIRQASR